MTPLPRVLALAAAAAVAASTFQIAPATALSASATRYDQSDSGTTAVVARGDKIKVVLKGNSSTGYTWKVNKKASNGVFKVTDVREESAAGPGHDGMPMPGAGSRYIYTLKATQAGDGVFRAKYVQPFGERDVADRFTLKVRVP